MLGRVSGFGQVGSILKVISLPTVVTSSALYNFTTFTFTNAGATGRNGPTYTQLLGAYTGSASWTATPTFFTASTPGIQVWTVPETATYRFTVAGAAGGNSPTITSASLLPNGTGVGGYGAYIVTDVPLTQNQKLAIVVGQSGGNRYTGSGAGAFNGASGGGGTFIYDSSSITYYVAAGGGGGALGAVANLFSNQISASGKFNTTSGSTILIGGGFIASGGIGGNGGNRSTRNILYGGPGAGVFTSGAAANTGQGLSRDGNWLGGSTGSTANINGVFGGFGGGGAAVDGDGATDGNVIAWAGGGGGYSGGGSGGNSGASNSSYGGGGGSFYTGSLVTGSNNTNTGHGYVTITKL
jgi:hypothetical protein